MGELAMALGDYLRAEEDSPRLLDFLPPGGAPGPAEDGPAEDVAERAPEPSPRPAETAEVEPVGPELPIEVPESGTLWKAWRQWTAIVEHFERRRPHGNVNKQTYEKLYRTLIAGCRAHAAKAQGPRKEFYLRLADLVLPWMTPRVLESTDREILSSVLAYCRQFEHELLDPTELLPGSEDGASSRHGWWLALFALLASFVLVLSWIYWSS
jgi:hypothetical protein